MTDSPPSRENVPLLSIPDNKPRRRGDNSQKSKIQFHHEDQEESPPFLTNTRDEQPVHATSNKPTNPLIYLSQQVDPKDPSKGQIIVLNNQTPDMAPYALFGREVPHPSFRTKIMRVLPLGSITLYVLFEIILEVSYGRDSCPMPLILGAISFLTVYAFSVPWIHWFETHPSLFHVLFHAFASGTTFATLTMFNKDVTSCLWNWVNPMVNAVVILSVWGIVTLLIFVMHTFDLRNISDDMWSEYNVLKESFYKSKESGGSLSASVETSHLNESSTTHTNLVINNNNNNNNDFDDFDE